MGHHASVLPPLPKQRPSFGLRRRFARRKEALTCPSSETSSLKGGSLENTYLENGFDSPSQKKAPPRQYDEMVFEACQASPNEIEQRQRAKYLGRLAYSGAWAPREFRPAAHQTVTILDWDDTLLCTSVLLDGSGKTRQSLLPQLRKIALLATDLLAMAQLAGPTFIITNAAEGWVEQSGREYLPELMASLEKVKIISARARFEPEFPGQTSEWKTQAFLEVQRQLNSDAIANLISVGDSFYEMDAVHAMGRQFAEAVVKTVKLWERPSAEDVGRQLELVCKEFSRIVAYPSDAKIRFARH